MRIMGARMRITRLEIGIFLVSFAVLLTELLLTRIFSVTMFYHLSFLVVSLAMLGFGASGLIVNLAPTRFPESKLYTQAAAGSVLFGITTVVAIDVSFQIPITLDGSPANWLRIGITYLMCAIPFLCGGMVVSLILSHRPAQAGRLYFADLLGAALGCVVFIPATNRLGAPSAVLMAATVAVLGGVVLLPRGAVPQRWGALAVAAALVLGLATNGRLHWYDVRYVKGTQQPPTLALAWNSFSRVDVTGTPDSLWTPHAPGSAGFSASLDPRFGIPEVRLAYDADASTQLTYFDGNLKRLGFLGFDVTSTPYQVRPYRDVLIIGPGGGRDILTALSFGAERVTGVEINPITIALMRGRFRTFTGGLYDGYPGVTIVNDDGRSYLRRLGRGEARYDLIEASLVDTWAASAAGAYALTENSLYTVDAFGDYFNRLTPDGVVCFNRWFPSPPMESLRVVSLIREALARRGIVDPAEHVMVLRTNPEETDMPSLGSILVKLTAFTPGEIAAARRFADEMGFLAPYLPGQVGNDFSALLGPEYQRFVDAQPFDLSAISDNRPFFFSRVPVLAWALHRLGLSSSPLGSAPLDLGGRTLVMSVVLTALATALLLLLPYWAERRRAPDLTTSGVHHGLWAIYFAGLGLGYILIEVVLIQRFSLFLGYPVYSLSVVLFTMLLSSALGSLASGRFTSERALPRALGLLIACLAVYAAGLPVVLSTFRGAAIAVRIGLAVGIIAPMGFLMGMPFPTGIRRVGVRSKRMVSWGWAANGGASVFGSTLSVLISMAHGFTATFLAGLLAYALALAVVRILWRTDRTIRMAEKELIA
jgi:hypothetical protein